MKITRKPASNSPVTFVINKRSAALFFLHSFSIFHSTIIFFCDVGFHSRSVPCYTAGAECSKCSKVPRHDNSSWNVPMVTVSCESFSSHLFLCYCLYHIAFFNENIGAIVTWSCFKNRITTLRRHCSMFETKFSIWVSTAFRRAAWRAKSPNSNRLSLQIAITGGSLARKV